VICKRPQNADWDVKAAFQNFSKPTAMFDSEESIVENLKKQLQSGDHVVVMSNSGFGGIHQKLLHALGAE
jgi:UDP-N-acetylmuramate: L-alanyl-gamma-D-glutamyl-meso-diaminopimelate ligase